MPSERSITPDGASLLRDAQAGRAEALGALLERHRGYLALLARIQTGQRLRGKVSASDVVQEAFLQAHRAFPQFRGSTEPEFESWLRTILLSRLDKQVRHFYGTAQRDLRRERALERAVGSSASAPLTLPGRGTSPSTGASRREQAVRLADALARLPEDYREVLVLRHFEDLTFPAVAERMQRSVGSVEKLWSRALARLRSCLGEL